MNRLLNTMQRVSHWFVWFAGVLIIGSALLVTVEVLLRQFANVSIGGADELSGYAFGVATSLSMAFALFERAHIRVDAAHALFPNWLKTVANLLGIVLLAGFVGVICYTAIGLVQDTITHGSRSITPMRTPLAIPQIPWIVGWIFFFLCCVLVLLGALVAIAKGDRVTTNRLIGTKTIDEQIEDESV